MKLNKVSYRVIDRLGWSGFPSIEEFIKFRKERMKDPYYVPSPIKRILKVTEEELDADELNEVNAKLEEKDV